MSRKKLPSVPLCGLPHSQHPTSNYSAERIAELSLARDAIDQVLAELTEQQRVILKLRFGLIGSIEYGYSHTLEECRHLTGLTRERVGQFHREAIEKLRHPCRKTKLEGFAYLVT
jgi:RNA polymerase primary sigma factor